MAEYTYQAYNKNGKQVTGSIEAVTENEATKKLSIKGLYPFKLELRSKLENKNSNKLRYSISYNKSDMQIFFTRQLANLLLAGVQLADALNILIKMMNNNSYQEIVENIYKSLKTGKSFADSVSISSGNFSADYLNMIRAGEESGALGLTCQKLATDLEERKKLKSFILTSLIYPVILLIVSILAVTVMLVFVLPRFIEIYKSYSMTLPWITQTVLSFSIFLKTNWIAISIFFISAITITWLYFNTTVGKNNFDRFVLNIPFIGNVIKEVKISDFSASLSLMLESGVPLLKSLSIIADTAGNVVYINGIRRTAEGVKKGKKLSEALSSSGVFPEILNYMIMIGEETGQLSRMLEQVAEQYKEEYRNNINRLLNLFEPMAILVMGILIGSIVIAMLLPVLGINTISF